MRTLWLMLATVGAIVIATGLYAWLQPSTKQHHSVVQDLSAAPPPTEPPPTTSDSSSIVQTGEDVWVKVPDAKTGQLSWQFRASRYDPQPDGSINVTKPQAEFFFSGGQIVSLRGTHGHVVMAGDMAKTADMRGPTSPPSRGEMYDVTISLYHTTNPRHPVLVCRMNNISFDNDTFRIATESFTDPNANIVAADQVPVTVRGDDYDFDGRGLVIRWDDRDHRLQSLEIAHGDTLVVKSQEALKGVTPASETTTSTQSTTPAAKPVGNRPKSAAQKKKAAPTTMLATPTTQPTTQKADSPVYRATFNGGVHVTQNNLPLAVADTMRIDFKSQDENSSDSTEASAPAPASPKKSASTASPKATAKPAATSAPPTTQPQAPIIVHWPGKLVVVPIDTNIPKLSPGQRNIEMISTNTPVVLDRTGSEVHCASFLYQGGDDSLDIRSSPAVPIITMKDADGGMLYTPSLKYNGTQQKAYLNGPSHAEVPMQNQQGTPASTTPEILKAKWSKSCLLTFAGPTRDQLAIQNANLIGDVDIDHPKLKLKSDDLNIGFAPSTTATTSTPAEPGKNGGSQVKDLTAFGNVRCETLDQDQKKRHINSDHLVVTTEKSPDGQLVPRTLVADGHVHTFDEEQDLKSGYLYAKLAPTTQPTDSTQVQNLFAQQNVQFAFKDTSGHCDQLAADADGDDYNVKLVGQPDATVISKDSTLNGPIINLQPKRQNVQVVGAGTMHGTQQQTPQSKATPFDVAWDSELNFNGSTNLGDAASNVVVKTVSNDGTVNTASGDKLTMELMDEPGSTTKPTTRPAGNSPMDFDTGNKKQLKTMTIIGNTEVKSILSAADGDLLRRTHLFAPLVRVEAADKKMIVPAAGRMLYEDLRATTQPSSAAASSTAAASPLGDMSGQTAFQWDHDMSYDQLQDRAEMVGNVVVVHQDSSGRGEPFRLDSERVVVGFEPTTGNKPTTQPSDAKVKEMSAEGSVQFLSRQIRFESDRMTFDTLNNLLTAYGTEHQPVEIYDENGVSSAIVQKAWWDTKTQQLGMRDISANMRK